MRACLFLSLLIAGFLFQAGTGASALAAEQSISSELAHRLSRVEEFRFIREEAEKLGVRAWLFGGTAAGYGHYVKWDLEREGGDPRFQKGRFDYDYTNIYRSTQDLDIVIDGDPVKAKALQDALVARYPHMQGSKTAWEVRLLSQDLGDKQALLNNPDFLNQHTDSNSTGMIELTKPPRGEPIVRDLRDWASKEPEFLKDVREGALHYYYSPLHETTKFSKEGRNPPILSAIRYLTKAVQYELKIRPEDRKRIEKVIREFDPRRDAKNPYVAAWIEKNGKKLIQNAVNIEYAVDLLDELGLRQKLASIKSNPGTEESLAWWMGKEPLRSKPVGQGRGRTAKQLGIVTVSHETNNFLAYESITRAPTGDPNVLISRTRYPGENAAYGNGFYTRIGREGARGTGLTIRFRLKPGAREGKSADFTLVDDYVVIHNKNAIEVIPESLDFSLTEYLEYLRSGNGFEASDKALLEKLKRRVSAKANTLSAEEKANIIQMGLQEMRKPNPSLPFLEEWASYSFVDSARNQALKELLQKERLDLVLLILPPPEDPKLRPIYEGVKNYARSLHRLPPDQWKRSLWYGQLMNDLDALIQKSPNWVGAKLRDPVERYMSQMQVSENANLSYFQRHPRTESPTAAKLWKQFDELAKTAAEFKGFGSVMANWIQSPSSVDRPDILRLAFRQDPMARQSPPSVLLDSPHWAKTKAYEELLKPFFQAKSLSSREIEFLESPAASANPKLIRDLSPRIIRELKDSKSYLRDFGYLARANPAKLPKELKSALFERMKKDSTLTRYFFEHFLNSPGWPASEPYLSNWLKWLSTTSGPGLEGDAIANVFRNARISFNLKNRDKLLIEAIDRASGETNYAASAQAISEQIRAGRPPSLRVIKEYLSASWGSAPDVWAAEWPIQWAELPIYRNDPGLPDLFPLLIKMVDEIHSESSVGDRIAERTQQLEALLAKEPFASDPRAELWRKALKKPRGTRAAWLEANTPCSKRFGALNARKSR